MTPEIPTWAWRAAAIIFALSTALLGLALVAVGWREELTHDDG